MLTVEAYELVRRKYHLDGMSIRQIAKELGHSRKTVNKVLGLVSPPGYRQSKPRIHRILGPYVQAIESWLRDDEGRPRKQRHTGQRVYERLRDEHGFVGSSSTVRRFVSRWKGHGKEVFVPLLFGPGEEAQVDWGEATVIMGGQERKIQLFCLRLCHSHRVFVRAYERANMESFLDGHVRGFQFLGGVPRRMAYDNLKSAVIRVGRGQDRKLNGRFLDLRNGYLFESRFCNVARGNEKGHVENLVKRTQRTFLTPLPEVDNFEELNQKLLKDCDKELDRRDTQGRLYRDLWESERSSLLDLPVSEFAAYREESGHADKRSLVQVENNKYSVPVRWAHHDCLIRIHTDKIVILCEHEVVAIHPRGHGRGGDFLDPNHYLPMLRTKPGTLKHGKPFQGHPWGKDFDLLRQELEYRLESAGTREFIEILLLMTCHGQEAVTMAVSDCVRRRLFSLEAVKAALRPELVPVTIPRLSLDHLPHLALEGTGIRPASLYDQLYEVDEGEWPRETESHSREVESGKEVAR